MTKRRIQSTSWYLGTLNLAYGHLTESKWPTAKNMLADEVKW